MASERLKRERERRGEASLLMQASFTHVVVDDVASFMAAHAKGPHHSCFTARSVRSFAPAKTVSRGLSLSRHVSPRRRSSNEAASFEKECSWEANGASASVVDDAPHAPVSDLVVVVVS